MTARKISLSMAPVLTVTGSRQKVQWQLQQEPGGASAAGTRPETWRTMKATLKARIEEGFQVEAKIYAPNGNLEEHVTYYAGGGGHKHAVPNPGGEGSLGRKCRTLIDTTETRRQYRTAVAPPKPERPAKPERAPRPGRAAAAGPEMAPEATAPRRGRKPKGPVVEAPLPAAEAPAPMDKAPAPRGDAAVSAAAASVQAQAEDLQHLGKLSGMEKVMPWDAVLRLWRKEGHDTFANRLEEWRAAQHQDPAKREEQYRGDPVAGLEREIDEELVYVHGGNAPARLYALKDQTLDLFRNAPAVLERARGLLHYAKKMIESSKCQGVERKQAIDALSSATAMYGKARQALQGGQSWEALKHLRSLGASLALTAAKVARSCAAGQQSLLGRPAPAAPPAAPAKARRQPAARTEPKTGPMPKAPKAPKAKGGKKAEAKEKALLGAFAAAFNSPEVQQAIAQAANQR